MEEVPPEMLIKAWKSIDQKKKGGREIQVKGNSKKHKSKSMTH